MFFPQNWIFALLVLRARFDVIRPIKIHHHYIKVISYSLARHCVIIFLVSTNHYKPSVRNSWQIYSLHTVCNCPLFKHRFHINVALVHTSSVVTLNLVSIIISICVKMVSKRMLLSVKLMWSNALMINNLFYSSTKALFSSHHEREVF